MGSVCRGRHKSRWLLGWGAFLYRADTMWSMGLALETMTPSGWQCAVGSGGFRACGGNRIRWMNAWRMRAMASCWIGGCRASNGQYIDEIHAPRFPFYNIGRRRRRDWDPVG